MASPNSTPPFAAALAWLEGRINYERRPMPAGGRGLKLDRMRDLLARLGNPERQLRAVHVAGTKGKGSTSAMIASILTSAGFKTGLFTSPHLDSVCERFAIDGRACGQEQFVALVDQLRPVVAAMDAHGKTKSPTYFEITTALAMLHFAGQQVDLAVLEVGLGGRLDSTNVCLPVVSVITSISYDHTRQLGSTLESIAREKAGIVKPGVPVVSGVRGQEACDVIRRVAADRGCRLVQLDIDFGFKHYPANAATGQPATLDVIDDATGVRHERLALGLRGRHQAANAATAVASIAELRRAGWRIDESALRAGLARVSLPARAEVLSVDPTVVVDSAHNVASAEALVEVLAECFPQPASERTLIFGTTGDKDVAGMLKVLLPQFGDVLLTCYQENPRAVPPERLQQLAGGAGRVFATAAEAWEAVCSAAEPGRLIVVAGSFFLAAEMRRLIAVQPIRKVGRLPA
jgi:dihydrofolate synthase/folylpolyglutamate synthase